MNAEQTRALTEHEVATQLGLSVATLRAWRLKRRGPRYVRFGRAVRYLAADIDSFIEASRPDSRLEQLAAPKDSQPSAGGSGLGLSARSSS